MGTQALLEFLDFVPGERGREAYLEQVRKFALALYSRVAASGSPFFLDKTPRYYMILPELIEVFPDAKFVFLQRNPLDVLASIIDVSLNGRWHAILGVARRHDLVTAPRRIVEALQLLGRRSVVVNYEVLVSSPETTVRRITEYLGVPYDAAMIEYEQVHFARSHFVDPKSIYQHRRPVDHYVGRWKVLLESAETASIAAAYLQLLGKELLERMKYPYESLLRAAEERAKPSRVGWWQRHLEPSSPVSSRHFYLAAARCAFARRGVRGTVAWGLRRWRSHS